MRALCLAVAALALTFSPYPPSWAADADDAPARGLPLPGYAGLVGSSEAQQKALERDRFRQFLDAQRAAQRAANAPCPDITPEMILSTLVNSPFRIHGEPLIADDVYELHPRRGWDSGKLVAVCNGYVMLHFEGLPARAQQISARIVDGRLTIQPIYDLP